METERRPGSTRPGEPFRPAELEKVNVSALSHALRTEQGVRAGEPCCFTHEGRRVQLSFRQDGKELGDLLLSYFLRARDR